MEPAKGRTHSMRFVSRFLLKLVPLLSGFRSVDVLNLTKVDADLLHALFVLISEEKDKSKV